MSLEYGTRIRCQVDPSIVRITSGAIFRAVPQLIVDSKYPTAVHSFADVQLTSLRMLNSFPGVGLLDTRVHVIPSVVRTISGLAA
jgi:hypothetical protein